MSRSIFLFVSPISQTHIAEFRQFSVHVSCGFVLRAGGVAIRSVYFCSYGFVDDAMFSHNWPYGASRVSLAIDSSTALRILSTFGIESRPKLLHRFQLNSAQR